MSVLVVVDDSDEMVILIERMLSKDDHIDTGGQAATAEEAVELARRTAPDLVILNHFIEGDAMGLEAAPKIKAAAPSAKILLFSSHDLASEAKREPAVDKFLSKQHLSQLLPTVLDLLGLS